VPLKPQEMMEDIVGDYKDKTVTIEDFPFFDHAVKTASVHPCKHASVMKVLLDRADAALKRRLAKLKAGKDVGKLDSGMEGLVDDTKLLKLTEQAKSKDDGESKDDWEVLSEGGDDEVAIRVDQYLVVFLKFMARQVPPNLWEDCQANEYQCNTRHRARLHHGSLKDEPILPSLYGVLIAALLANGITAFSRRCMLWQHAICSDKHLQ
jgi:hypothetical protein